MDSNSVVKYTVNGILTATIDDQLLSATLIINSSPPESSTVVPGQSLPMQQTGVPLGLMILAIFMVLGGIVSAKK